MERQRIGSQYYENKYKGGQNKQNGKLSYVSYSIGRSAKKIDFRDKITNIKNKCLAKSIEPIKIITPSKLINNPEMKNHSLGDEDADSNYISSEEETDDAEI